jgi:hypothetical protein
VNLLSCQALKLKKIKNCLAPIHPPLVARSDPFTWPPQVGPPFLIALARWSLADCSTILHYGRDSLRNVFTCLSSPNGCRSSIIWFLLDAHHDFEFSTLMMTTPCRHPLISYMKSSFACKPMEWYLNPHEITRSHLVHRVCFVSWSSWIPTLHLDLINLIPFFYLFIMMMPWR